jgi:hypothetical protein
MENVPDRRMTHRKRLDIYERELTGGQPHYGHLPAYVQEIEGFTFRRCRCGFSLAVTPSGKVWWLRTENTAVEITDMKHLLRRAGVQLLGPSTRDLSSRRAWRRT